MEKPKINEVASFSAIYKLFDLAVKTVDILFYKELVTKREQLVGLVSDNKLTASKYKTINKTAASKTDKYLYLNQVLF